MPIKITKHEKRDRSDRGEEVAWLSDGDWNLPTQLRELERWLASGGRELPAAVYAIDVGFSPREGAAGGGERVSVQSLQIMAEKGMELWFSEYAPFVEEP